ncbi:MAG: AMP-binding protein [Ruminococcus sp.]|nr:AMP-binding protein [Ruminococcus sp.]
MEKANVKTLQDLIIQSAVCYGDTTFMKERAGQEDKVTTFAQLLENCKRTAAFLKEKGRSEKLHCAVIGLTSSAYLTAYFGSVIGGNIIVPLDAQMGVEDLCDHLQRSDSKVFFYDKRYAPMIPVVKESCPEIHTYICMQDDPKQEDVCFLPTILKETAPLEALPEIDPATCAAILYTSGTTGKSKGVMLSHANLIDNTMCQDNESTPEDVTLTVLPIHHVYCFTCDILLSLRYGNTVCVNDSMMHIAQNLKRYEPSIILLVPMIAETIYKKIQAAAASMPDIPLAAIARGVFGKNLRGIYSGGAYLNPELAKAYAELGIPIAQGYGMTECSPRITTGVWENECRGDVGVIVNGCTVKIEDGEIWAKSPSVMMGYYKDAEATAAALTEDGWLMTGDLGYVDERNRVHITGRKKNLIILSNGENVSPEELENKFAGLDWLSEILVYAEEGQITAEIFPNPEAGLSADEVQKLCMAHIQKVNKTVSGAKAIRRLRIRDVEFDKTTSKKIKRAQPQKGALCS